MCDDCGDGVAARALEQISEDLTMGPIRAVRPGATSVKLRPAAAAEDGELVVERIPITYEGYEYKYNHIVYVKGRGPAPVVLIHPNYAGLKQFDVDVASFLAQCGYVGFALDEYKETEYFTVEDRDPMANIRRQIMGATLEGSIEKPETLTDKDKDWLQTLIQDAQERHGGSYEQMGFLLSNPAYWRGLMGAGLAKAREHASVHKKYAGAIGYCLGGMCILEQVRAGHDIQAAVSFHGLLQSVPMGMSRQQFEQEIQIPNTYNKECKVLIENGDLDGSVPQKSIDRWKAEMDEQLIDWRFNNHAQTPHGFALGPECPGGGNAYTEAADRRSTLSMLSLFAEVWPEFPQYPVEVNACGTRLGQRIATAGNMSKL